MCSFCCGRTRYVATQKIPDTENIVETKANTSCGQLLYFSGDLNGHFAGGNLVIFIDKADDAK